MTPNVIFLWRPCAAETNNLGSASWSRIEFVLRGSYVEEAAHTLSIGTARRFGYGYHRTVRHWRRWSLHKVPTTHASRPIHVDRGTVVLVVRWRTTAIARTHP